MLRSHQDILSNPLLQIEKMRPRDISFQISNLNLVEILLTMSSTLCAREFKVNVGQYWVYVQGIYAHYKHENIAKKIFKWKFKFMGDELCMVFRDMFCIWMVGPREGLKWTLYVKLYSMQLK